MLIRRNPKVLVNPAVTQLDFQNLGIRIVSDGFDTRRNNALPIQKSTSILTTCLILNASESLIHESQTNPSFINVANGKYK